MRGVTYSVVVSTLYSGKHLGSHCRTRGFDETGILPESFPLETSDIPISAGVCHALVSSGKDHIFAEASAENCKLTISTQEMSGEGHGNLNTELSIAVVDADQDNGQIEIHFDALRCICMKCRTWFTLESHKALPDSEILHFTNQHLMVSIQVLASRS